MADTWTGGRVSAFDLANRLNQPSQPIQQALPQVWYSRSKRQFSFGGKTLDSDDYTGLSRILPELQQAGPNTWKTGKPEEAGDWRQLDEVDFFSNYVPKQTERTWDRAAWYGVERGVYGMAELGANVLNWFGLDKGEEWANALERERAKTDVFIPSLSEALESGEPSDYLLWATAMIAEQVPYVAATAGSGGIGAVAATARGGATWATRFAGTGAGKQITRLATNREHARKAQLAAQKKLKGEKLSKSEATSLRNAQATLGATMGATATGYLIGLGDTFGEMREHDLTVGPGGHILSAMVAVPYAAMNTIGHGATVRALIGPAARAAGRVTQLDKALPKNASKAKRAAKAAGRTFGDFTKAGLVSSVVEGLTEGAQEGMVIGARAGLGAGFQEGDWERVRDAAAGGALIGMALGGPGGTYTRPRARRKAAELAEQGKQIINEMPELKPQIDDILNELGTPQNVQTHELTEMAGVGRGRRKQAQAMTGQVERFQAAEGHSQDLQSVMARKMPKVAELYQHAETYDRLTEDHKVDNPKPIKGLTKEDLRKWREARKALLDADKADFAAAQAMYDAVRAVPGAAATQPAPPAGQPEGSAPAPTARDEAAPGIAGALGELNIPPVATSQISQAGVTLPTEAQPSQVGQAEAELPAGPVSEPSTADITDAALDIGLRGVTLPTDARISQAGQAGVELPAGPVAAPGAVLPEAQPSQVGQAGASLTDAALDVGLAGALPEAQPSQVGQAGVDLAPAPTPPVPPVDEQVPDAAQPVQAPEEAFTPFNITQVSRPGEVETAGVQADRREAAEARESYQASLTRHYEEKARKADWFGGDKGHEGVLDKVKPGAESDMAMSLYEVYSLTNPDQATGNRVARDGLKKPQRRTLVQAQQNIANHWQTDPDMARRITDMATPVLEQGFGRVRTNEELAQERNVEWAKRQQAASARTDPQPPLDETIDEEVHPEAAEADARQDALDLLAEGEAPTTELGDAAYIADPRRDRIWDQLPETNNLRERFKTEAMNALNEAEQAEQAGRPIAAADWRERYGRLRNEALRFLQAQAETPKESAQVVAQAAKDEASVQAALNRKAPPRAPARDPAEIAADRLQALRYDKRRRVEEVGREDTIAGVDELSEPGAESAALGLPQTRAVVADAHVDTDITDRVKVDPYAFQETVDMTVAERTRPETLGVRDATAAPARAQARAGAGPVTQRGVIDEYDMPYMLDAREYADDISALDADITSLKAEVSKDNAIGSKQNDELKGWRQRIKTLPKDSEERANLKRRVNERVAFFEGTLIPRIQANQASIEAFELRRDARINQLSELADVSIEKIERDLVVANNDLRENSERWDKAAKRVKKAQKVLKKAKPNSVKAREAQNTIAFAKPFAERLVEQHGALNKQVKALEKAKDELVAERDAGRIEDLAKAQAKARAFFAEQDLSAPAQVVNESQAAKPAEPTAMQRAFAEAKAKQAQSEGARGVFPDIDKNELSTVRRREDLGKTSGEGLSVQATRHALKRAARAWHGVRGIQTHVYSDVADLKAQNPELYTRIKASDAQLDSRHSPGLAYMDSDGKPTVVLFARHNTTTREAQFTAAHEVLGHVGLRAVMPGPQFDAIMQQAARESIQVHRAAKRKIDSGAVNNWPEAVEEALADMSAYLDANILARVWSRVKNGLNKLGMKFDDDWARYLIWHARRYVRNGQNSPHLVRMSHKFDAAKDLADFNMKVAPVIRHRTALEDGGLSDMLLNTDSINDPMDLSDARRRAWSHNLPTTAWSSTGKVAKWARQQVRKLSTTQDRMRKSILGGANARRNESYGAREESRRCNRQ